MHAYLSGVRGFSVDSPTSYDSMTIIYKVKFARTLESCPLAFYISVLIQQQKKIYYCKNV